MLTLITTVIKKQNKKKQKTKKQQQQQQKKTKNKKTKNKKQQTNKLYSETIIDYWGIGYGIDIHHWISILASVFASVNIGTL